ncbi:hypothetical protein M3Y97_00092800 [Aphelenchoides bicaudatus]|nr:hypothetical protein M3Y97_00092800 [Aphelenchoides bicaudatus]
MELIVGALESRLAVRHYRHDGQRESRFPRISRYNCAQLSNIDRLSIKFKDPQIHSMINGWDPSRHFNTITFIVRNEDNHKQTLLEVDMESAKGLTVKNTQGKPIMVIKLPNNDPTSLGKLMHPAPATLYKVISSPSPVGMNYSVQHSTDKRTLFNLEKVPVSIYQLGKAIGVLSSNCVYWFKAPDGETVLGYVRPKLVLKSNTLMIKFMSTNRDPQVRATMLGCALLLFISESYPTLRALLQESVRKAEPF